MSIKVLKCKICKSKEYGTHDLNYFICPDCLEKMINQRKEAQQELIEKIKKLKKKTGLKVEAIREFNKTIDFIVETFEKEGEKK